MRFDTLGKPPVKHAHAAVMFACCVAMGCQGEGSFFSAIVDGGTTVLDASPDGSGGTGGSGATGGSGGAPLLDAGDNDSGATDSGVGSWSSPFPNTGAPGWRDSTQTLCAETSEFLRSSPIDIWSDSRGVFALVLGTSEVDTTWNDAGFAECLFCGELLVLQNDGTGWRRYQTLTADLNVVASVPDIEFAFALSGIPAGPLLVAAPGIGGTMHPWCALLSVTDNLGTCVARDETVDLLSQAGSQHAIAVQGSTLLRYDGTRWHPEPLPLPEQATAAWGDHATVLITTSDSLMRRSEGTWTVERLPFAGVSAIWSTAEATWLGTNTGDVWNFDGQAWQQVGRLGGTTCGDLRGVRGFWSHGDTTFAYGDHSLLRWQGSQVESLGNWSCTTGEQPPSIVRLWGNAADDVFIALDSPTSADSCGRSVVMHFDGRVFHRM